MCNFIFYSLLLLLSPLSWGSPLHVVIDPGHGGYDKGAVGKNAYESQITLEVSKRLLSRLKKDPLFDVTMTRSSNKHLTLKQRAELANEVKGDLFLSIHVNASPDARAKGAEIFFQNQLSSDQDSMFLANRENNSQKEELDKTKAIEVVHSNPYVQSILNDIVANQRVQQSSELAKSLVGQWSARKKKNKHVIRQAPFFVISNVNMPSALVELGFITNPRERKELKSKNYQELLADSIYRGLLSYREGLTK